MGFAKLNPSYALRMSEIGIEVPLAELYSDVQFAGAQDDQSAAEDTV